MSISGTLLIQPTSNTSGDRQIATVLGVIALPSDKMSLFAPANQLQIVRGDPSMLGLYLTGERVALPEMHQGQSFDYLMCQSIWRAP